MPIPYIHHIFVCTNERPAGSPRGCCKSKGSVELHAALKEAVAKAGLSNDVRVNKSGCLDHCEQGATVVVYPEAVWYGHVALTDVEEIVREHLVNGRPVERLRIA